MSFYGSPNSTLLLFFSHYNYTSVHDYTNSMDGAAGRRWWRRKNVVASLPGMIRDWNLRTGGRRGRLEVVGSWGSREEEARNQRETKGTVWTLESGVPSIVASRCKISASIKISTCLWVGYGILKIKKFSSLQIFFLEKSHVLDCAIPPANF